MAVPTRRDALDFDAWAAVIVAAGAAPDDGVGFPITGWWWGGALTRRSAQIG